VDNHTLIGGRYMYLIEGNLSQGIVNLTKFFSNERLRPVYMKYELIPSSALIYYELWRTNGTEVSTYMEKDINPSGSSELSDLTELNGILYFRAQNETGSEALWRSNGTSLGTFMFKDIDPSGNAEFYDIIALNGHFFINLDHSVHYEELWIY